MSQSQTQNKTPSQSGSTRRLVINGSPGGRKILPNRPTQTHKPRRAPSVEHQPPHVPHVLFSNGTPSNLAGPGYPVQVNHCVRNDCFGVNQPHSESVRSHRVYVDGCDVGFVIGSGGATIKRIKHQCRALIKYFPPEQVHEGNGMTTGFFNIRGNERQIHTAKISILELVVESKRRSISQLSSSAGAVPVHSTPQNTSMVNDSYKPKSPIYDPS